jgi:hypothetical protein
MSSSLHTEGLSIVFLGFFNPKIFQPAWFAHQGLIREQEAEGAKLEIVHQEAVIFKTEWFHFEVFQERAMFLTTQSQFFEPLRDLALGTFRILQHTPLTKMGINREMHFSCTEEARNALAEKIAPREPWKQIGVDTKLATMTTLAKRPDDYKGAIFIKVEASQRAIPGIFVSINDHYEVANEKEAEGANEILSMLEAAWKQSTSRSLEMASKLIGT